MRPSGEGRMRRDDKDRYSKSSAAVHDSSQCPSITSRRFPRFGVLLDL